MISFRYTEYFRKKEANRHLLRTHTEEQTAHMEVHIEHKIHLMEADQAKKEIIMILLIIATRTSHIHHLHHLKAHQDLPFLTAQTIQIFL